MLLEINHFLINLFVVKATIFLKMRLLKEDLFCFKGETMQTLVVKI